MTESKLDCCGLHCPIPIVKISRAFAKMQAGDELVVQADDPAFGADITAWVQLTGNELLTLDEGAVSTARLKRVA